MYFACSLHGTEMNTFLLPGISNAAISSTYWQRFGLKIVLNPFNLKESTHKKRNPLK